MKNATLKTFTFLLAFAMVIALFPATSLFAASNYSYDTKTKTLTISYTGAMPTYDTLAKRPWDTYSNSANKIVIKNGITSISDIAFYNFHHVTEIVWPTDGKLKTIGNSAFYCCCDLKSLVLPKGVTSIGNFAFENCEQLSKISFPGTLKTIGMCAFAVDYGGDMKYTSLSIPSSVTSIGSYAFFNNDNLKSVTGGSGLVTIGSYAFYSCAKLATFKVTSKKLKTIGAYAFKSCPKLKTIYIQKTTKLTKKTVKNSLKSSSVKTVKVKSTKVKTYKKYFTKSNCGRKVTVKK